MSRRKVELNLHFQLAVQRQLRKYHVLAMPSQSKTEDEFCRFLQNSCHVVSHHSLARLKHLTSFSAQLEDAPIAMPVMLIKLSHQDGPARSLKPPNPFESSAERLALSDIGASRLNHFSWCLRVSQTDTTLSLIQLRDISLLTPLTWSRCHDG